MFKLLEKKSIIYLWIATYAVTIIAPIIANIYIFNGIHTQLKNEININNQYFLNNVSKTFDNAFSDINTVSIDVRRNGNIADILKHESLLNQTRFLAANAVDDLQYEKLKSRFINDIFVYIPKIDLIITSEAFYESEAYFRNHVKEKNTDYGSWKSNLLSATGKTYIDGTIEDNVSRVYEVLRFIEPLGDMNNDNRFILNIDIEKRLLFSDIEGNDKNPRKAMLLLNGKNEVIYQYGGMNRVEPEMLNLVQEYNMSSLSYENKKYSYSYVKSNVYRYKYVYITPYNVFRQKINKAMYVNISVNFLCLLLMIIIVWYFIKWNYGKISSILETLTNKKTGKIFLNTNEYQLIKETVSNTVDEKQKLSNKLELQIDVLKNGFLADCLKGFLKRTDDIDEKFKNYSIDFPHKHFVVSAVYISDFGIMAESTKSDTVFIVKNIMEDLPLKHAIEWVEMDGMLFLIINIDMERDSDYKQSLKTFFESGCELAYEALSMSFNVATSSLSNDFNEVSNLYREAVSILEYSSFYEVYETIFYDEIGEENSVALYNYSYAEENSLIVNIKTGNREGAEKALKDLLVKCIKKGHVGKQVVEGVTYSIVNIMTKAVNEIDDYNVGKIFADTKYLKDFEACKTVGEYEGYLFNLLEKIFEEYNSANEKSHPIYDDVKRYVDEHFKDSNLTVSYIGEYFNMSSLYLSRVFKWQSGNKLNSYINDLRINYAKEILKDKKNYKIDDIAKMSGFDNTRTFVNAFKLRAGVTPTQYKTLS